MKTVVCPNRDGELRLPDAADKEPQEYSCPACGRPMAQGESFEGVDHEHLVTGAKGQEVPFRWPMPRVEVPGGYKA